jgi:hypothetical protein
MIQRLLKKDIRKRPVSLWEGLLTKYVERFYEKKKSAKGSKNKRPREWKWADLK